jgi:amino acid transporter
MATQTQLEAVREEPRGSAPGQKGLKPGAISFVSNVVIGTASVAPAYSLAATLGFIVAVPGVGLSAPAVLVVSFVPMLCIAFAYNYMNRADPDCGTSFAWVTRAMGPQLGWITGWAIVAADVIVMASLAQIAGIYTFLLVGWQSAAATSWAVTLVGCAWIVLMTWICLIGIELNATTQRWLLSAEVSILGLFAVVALVKGGAATPSLDWVNPFHISSFGALADGVLLGLFIYWGWDSGVAVNEESEDKANGPGKAAVISTLLLLAIYLITSAAAQSFAGPQELIDNADDVLSALGGQVLPSPLDKLLIITVLTSASSSTQTTILPTARATLSMARQKAFPPSFGRIHPRYLTPSYSTIWMGVVSTIWFIAIQLLSPDNVLGDSVTALGFGIAFYYGLTGIACVVFYRRELRKDFKTFFYAGVLPLAGALALFGIAVKAFVDYQNPDNTNTDFLGIGSPVVIGVGALLLGVVVMFFARFRYREFFSRKREVFDPATAGQAIVPEEAV